MAYIYRPGRFDLSTEPYVVRSEDESNATITYSCNHTSVVNETPYCRVWNGTKNSDEEDGELVERGIPEDGVCVEDIPREPLPCPHSFCRKQFRQVRVMELKFMDEERETLARYLDSLHQDEFDITYGMLDGFGEGKTAQGDSSMQGRWIFNAPRARPASDSTSVLEAASMVGTLGGFDLKGVYEAEDVTISSHPRFAPIYSNVNSLNTGVSHEALARALNNNPTIRAELADLFDYLRRTESESFDYMMPTADELSLKRAWEQWNL